MRGRGTRALIAAVLLTVTAGTTAVDAAAPPAAPAGAASSLPAGWSFDGGVLAWTSPVPLHIGGARYEFRDGGAALGVPAQDGDVLRLPLAGRAAPAAPEVWAAGRRLDAAAPSPARVAAAPVDAVTAVAAADPAEPGPYGTRRLRYDLGGLDIAGYPAPVEVVGEVTVPVGAPGARPLVLFLHGRHSTCYRGGPGGEASGDWPCAAGWKPVPSQTGYRYMTDVLASQGYLTVSIAANGINGQDAFLPDAGASARSQLVRHHLGLWAQWSAAGGDPWGGRFRGRVDLGRVVLVGHSRGGEGVARATIDSDPDDPWTIRGLVLIGPTAFGRQVPAGVHTIVILPFCDGDVSDLQGQQYVDAGRDLAADGTLRTSVVAMGTNHNFFNTEWTPGLSKSPAWDDWYDPGDPRCGDRRDQRLLPAEQQTVGLAYTAALVDLALAGDASVLPLLDGTQVRPRSIGRASTHVSAIGAAKPLLYAPGRGATVRATGMTARECLGYVLAGPFSLGSDCDPDRWFEMQPHWSPVFTAETAPSPVALEVRWRRAGGSLTVPVQGDLTGADAVDLRIVGEPGAAATPLRVRVRDARGRAVDAVVRPATLWPYWGSGVLGKELAKAFRVVLPAGVDRSRVTSIEILPGGRSGRFWLLDATAHRRALPVATPTFLPRVNVGSLSVPEGDGTGSREVQVPITIDRPSSQPAEVWVQVTDYSTEQQRLGFALTIPAGATEASVPVTVRSDDVFTPFAQPVQVTLLARSGAVTGEYLGTVTVVEDDPAPTLTVDNTVVATAEGGTLTWTFHLSAPVASGLFWSLLAVAPEGRFAELDTDDIPLSWFEERGLLRPDPAVPLSQSEVWLWIAFDPGQTEATITLPIATDALAEPEEGVVLVLEGFDDPIVPTPIELTGTVTAG